MGTYFVSTPGRRVAFLRQAAQLACDDTLAALHLSQVCIGMGLPLDREGGSMGLPMMELPNFS